MTNSDWCKGCHNVELAGSLNTNGDDYDKFLKALFEKTILRKDIVDDMEGDYPPECEGPTLEAEVLAIGLGHYGLANWLDCPFSDPAKLFFPKKCKTQNIRSSMGWYGYYPIIDRERGYWMQIINHGNVAIMLEGIIFRTEIKPLIDAAHAGEMLTTE